MAANQITHRPVSLVLRVTAFVGITITVLLLAFGWIILRSIEQHFSEQDADELRVVAEAVRQSLGVSPLEQDGVALRRQLENAVSGHHGVFFQVSETGGQPIYATPGPDLSDIARRVKPVHRIDANSLHQWQDHQWQGNQKAYRGAVLRMETGRPDDVAVFTVVVATGIEFHLNYIAGFRYTLWITTFFACVIALLAAWFAVHRGLAPLRYISDEIRGISSDQLHVRLSPETVPIELAELAASFNDMLARIEDVFHRLSNFSADIAHELRTPVTNLTTQTQVALSKARDLEQYREILYSNLEEYERMAKMIGDMLFLAQTEQGLLKPENADLDLTAEVQALFDYFEAWAEENDVSLKLEGSAPRACGDRLMMRRALSNLLSNAIRYTPPGQAVTVTLAMEAGRVVLAVKNPGAGIPPWHLRRLFDRFYRVDPSRQRKGDEAGLGLAIVKSIIDAHGGTITAASADGITTFQLALPPASTSNSSGEQPVCRETN